MSTARQNQIFEFVRDHIGRHGFAPTIREIGEVFDLNPGGVAKAIDALVGQKRLVKKLAGSRNLAIAGEVDLQPVTTEALWAELARRGETFDAMAEPRVIGGRACAADRCREQVRPGQLMCRAHWFKLPGNYRTAIMGAWSGRHLQAYGEAVTAARNYLGGYQRVVERVG